MDKNNMTCHECGCDITSTKGTLYNTDLRTYTCKSCVNKMIHQMQDYELPSEERSKMYVFLVLGIAFFFLSVPYFFSGNTVKFISSLLMFPASIVFIVLYCKAWFRAKHKRILSHQTKKYNKQQKKLKAEIEAAKPYNKPWSCSACGAQTIGQRCEYCDSPYNIGE